MRMKSLNNNNKNNNNDDDDDDDDDLMEIPQIGPYITLLTFKIKDMCRLLRKKRI